MLRVRWAEVDMQKIVFNAHYLMYFDTAVADHWRQLALPYEAAMQTLGGDLYVKKASVEYHASAHYDDTLNVAVRCSKIGNSSMVFEGAIFRGAQVLITSELLYVFADPSTQKSKPVPDALRKLFLGYEAGEPVVSVHVDDWVVLQPEAMQLRHEVFASELAMPPELMSDEADADAQHVVVRNRLGQAVATGRIAASVGGAGKIGRMAVRRVLRGSRLGNQVMDALELAAQARGDERVVLHAQVTAQGFYERRGYSVSGTAFEEASVMHIRMEKAIRA